ncbi:MAG: hypothetical protein RLZZ519_296 [Bacteroidota bacterium]
MEAIKKRPALDVRLFLYYQVRHSGRSYQNFMLPVENADPSTYLACSLAGTGAVCCTMTGAFEITVEGKRWLLWEDEDQEDEPDIAGLPWNAMGTTLGWIYAATEMLKGKRRVQIGPHDDEEPILLTCDRHGHVRYQIEDFIRNAPSIPLFQFAPLLHAEGKKFQHFSEVVLDLIAEHLQSESLAPKERKQLEGRRNQINGWQLKKQLAEMADCLQAPQRSLPWVNAWENVLELIEEYPPSIQLELSEDEAKGSSRIVIAWTSLPKEELPLLEAFDSHPERSKPISWKNPFQNHPKLHFLESMVREGASVRLCLRAKPRKKRGNAGK